MKIRLVSFSKPTEEFLGDGVSNVQELIAFCARVSNPSNQVNNETSEKLINYLIKNKHWSPLEMVSACIEIETTRDIARQILRHRSFSFQEFSQRYADPTKDLSFVTRDAAGEVAGVGVIGGWVCPSSGRSFALTMTGADVDITQASFFSLLQGFTCKS